MYNINLKNTRKGYGFGSMFFIVGLLFFAIMVTITFGGMFKKLSMDSSVEASSIDSNGHYDSDGAIYIHQFIITK